MARQGDHLLQSISVWLHHHVEMQYKYREGKKKKGCSLAVSLLSLHLFTALDKSLKY